MKRAVRKARENFAEATRMIARLDQMLRARPPWEEGYTLPMEI